MTFRALLAPRALRFASSKQCLLVRIVAHPAQPRSFRRTYVTGPFPSQSPKTNGHAKFTPSTLTLKAENVTEQEPNKSREKDQSLPPGWEDDPDFNISHWKELPHEDFGVNQFMIINHDFKEALRQVLWHFKAPIRYAFAYGSGVFPQSSSPSSTPSANIHPNPPSAVTKWQEHGQKNIDFIFGVTHTQHWHSLNITQHRDHYSALGSLGSGAVSRVQDNFGAGAYFHPYITVNGMMVKYGVVNLDTLYRDLSEWDTMYMAGRLQKPVKILRDDARIRLANQVNLISALRTALLLLPPNFTERELYTKIASISYMGDPRMAFRAENPKKVSNIVDNQMTNFRQLYLPLIDDLPNVSFNDPATSTRNWTMDARLDCNLQQDMDPVRRGNMVRRLPKKFRQRLYNSYQRSFRLTPDEYKNLLEQSKDESSFTKSVGTDFDRKIAQAGDLSQVIVRTVKETINGPSMTEAVKGVFTAGFAKSWRYLQEKREKGRTSKAEKKAKSDDVDVKESGYKDSEKK